MLAARLPASCQPPAARRGSSRRSLRVRAENLALRPNPLAASPLTLLAGSDGRVVSVKELAAPRTVLAFLRHLG
jgi:hypothetical protein